MRTKNILFLILVLAISLTIINCSKKNNKSKKKNNQQFSSWPVFRGSNSLCGVSNDPIPDNPKLLWKFNTKDMIVSTLVIDEKVVISGQVPKVAEMKELLTNNQ